MIERITEPLDLPMPWLLTFSGSRYYFQTEHQATVALMLRKQADQVLTINDGSSPARQLVNCSVSSEGSSD